MKKYILGTLLLTSTTFAAGQSQSTTAVSTDQNFDSNSNITQSILFREVGSGRTALQLTPGQRIQKSDSNAYQNPGEKAQPATTFEDNIPYMDFGAEHGLGRGFSIGAKLGYESGVSSDSGFVDTTNTKGLEDIYVTGKYLKSLSLRTSFLGQLDLGISPGHKTSSITNDGSHVTNDNAYSGGQSATGTLAFQTKASSLLIMGAFVRGLINTDKIEDTSRENSNFSETTIASGQNALGTGGLMELQGRQASLGLELDSVWVGEGTVSTTSQTQNGSLNSHILPYQMLEGTLYASIHTLQYEIIPSFKYGMINHPAHLSPNLNQAVETDLNLGMRFVF